MDCATSMPSLSSSPWILVALRPHSGFSRLMRRIRSRTGEVIRFPHADATSIASKRQSPFDANAQRSVGLALLHGTGLEDRNHPRGKSNTPTKNCILSAKYRADYLVSGAMYMPKCSGSGKTWVCHVAFEVKGSCRGAVRSVHHCELQRNE